ncbi:hypothetical protein [Maliponia aquimaris]|uniref:Uncharacterized protein n=1 Tax=Maliponia aquimaris TaxID=1673631 RepID=A0A238K204_9RHOB|nr:hypothetical protein [Maliponia aquimaris]SMX36941.1 hypothetical protein MAA8898_01123 [Maliponia aquimaris]
MSTLDALASLATGLAALALGVGLLALWLHFVRHATRQLRQDGMARAMLSARWLREGLATLRLSRVGQMSRAMALLFAVSGGVSVLLAFVLSRLTV